MYVPTIGLEVHAELNTESKMFCGCANNPHSSEPNAHVCPICMAHPGTLPVPNQKAIEQIITFGFAVEGDIAAYSEFDRKNYFYPDIPKAYQISQYAYPFVSAGSLYEVALTRVHLEEDTARSQHDHDAGSVVDFNRAGVPLMELVTEPTIHDAATAGEFARELQLLLRSLGISNANMERGELRLEANISVSSSEQLGTKVEVKNLNSFRSVEDAIAYEIDRQKKLLENGNDVVQETRGWDENKNSTYSQRAKETAKDYRYFPDPDIPKIALKETQDNLINLSRLNEIRPETPSEKRLKYRNIGLTNDQIETIIASKSLDDYFTTLVSISDTYESGVVKLSVNYLITDLSAQWSVDQNMSKTIQPSSFIALIRAVYEGKIGSRVAKDLIYEFAQSDRDLVAVAEERDLLQSNDTESLTSTVEEILTENPTVVADYKSGKTSALQFMVGQGMKKTKGSANPQMLQKLLIEQMG